MRTKAKDNGKNIFQQSLINWSTRYLGKEARTQIKKNKIKLVFIPRIKESRNKNVVIGWSNQPPKNKITVKTLIRIIEPYSAKKIKQNPSQHIQH